MEELKVTIEKAEGELTIRTGDALPLKDPIKINLSGDIKTVANFLQKRTEQSKPLPENAILVGPGCGLQHVNYSRAIVLVDKLQGTIELQLDPENVFGATVKGSLLESDELKIFAINSTKTYTREEIIKLFRFNKLQFDDADKNVELVKAFQKFSAKAFVEMNKEDDTRGNRENHFSKKVETGLPHDFILFIPLFKGQPKERFRVEIALDVTDGGAKFWFESPELVELMQQRKEEILKAELQSCEGFVVVNK